MRRFIKLRYYCIRYKILYKYLMFNYNRIKKYNITLSDKKKYYLERKLKKAYDFSLKVIETDYLVSKIDTRKEW